MDHFAGLDVSVKATSVCIVDDTGKFVREVRWRVKQEFLLRMPAPPRVAHLFLPSMSLASACCTPSLETSRVIEGLSDLRKTEERRLQLTTPEPFADRHHPHRRTTKRATRR